MKFSRIVLASGSPRRRELLAQVGMQFDVIVSSVDETITGLRPDETVCELSRRKAEAVYNSIEDNRAVLVIGADTVVSAGGRILGKPKNFEEACDMIKILAGGEHSVYTGVTLIIDGICRTFSEETKVHLYPMTDEQIVSYVRSGEAMDKAGAYGIQGRFAAYVRGIEGDYNNVVGLPTGRICEELRKSGYEI